MKNNQLTKNLSMHPLKPEEALTAFMKIDKKKLLRIEKKERELV